MGKRLGIILCAIACIAAGEPKKPPIENRDSHTWVTVNAPTFQFSAYERPSHDGWLGIPFDGWVAIVTGLLTVATVGLWWVTRQTLNHARESSEREARAYVFAEADKLENVSGPGKLRVTINVINTGRTPAYDVQISSDLVGDHPRPAGGLPPLQFPSHGTRMTIAAGRSATVVDEHDPLVEADFVKIRAGEWTLLHYGHIKYRDAFGKRRYTTFRYVLAPVAEGAFSFVGHGVGNDSD